MLGIILAGGYSSRAKLNKLLLEVNGQPMICRTIQTMRPFVDRLVAVTGRYHKELQPVLTKEGVEVAYNPNYEKGMFSSVLTGLNQVRDEDIFLLPGDIPNVSRKTYEALLKEKGDVRIPTYEGKEGHPLFLSNYLVKEARKQPLDSNMHQFLDKYEDVKIRVKVDDPFINVDVDTLEDYQKLCSLIERK